VWGASLVILALVGSAPLRASAEECDLSPSSVLETFPASGARETPRNGVAVILYCPPEDPFVDRSSARLLADLGSAETGCFCPRGGECLVVGFSEQCLEELPTRVEIDGDRVTVETLGGDLAGGTRHVIEAPEPSGVARIFFTTGMGMDQSPPVFAGPTSMRVIGCGAGYPASAACAEDMEGVVVVISAPAATDEAGRVNLEYAALLETDHGLVERGRARGDGAADVTMSIFVPVEDLAAEDDRICFRMAARDPYGHETIAEGRLCDHTPDYSPFGHMCGVAPAGEGCKAWPAGVLLMAALVLTRRLNGRRRRP